MSAPKSKPSSSTKPAANSSTTVTKSVIIPTNTLGIEWICVHPSAKDKAWELGSDSDDEEEEEEEVCDGPDCVCKQPADEHPEYLWKMSKGSQDLWTDWEEQKATRDQEIFDLHIYNNFSAYGCTEVMQNMLLAFDKEVKKPKKNLDVKALWKNVEAMAWFLNGDLFTWRMSNDSDGNAVLVSMFGTALLASIDILISRDLFDNNSELRNIGLVLAKFIKFATEVGDDELCRSGENKWKKAVIRLVNEHGIFLYGVSGIRDIEDAIKDSIGDDDSDESEGPLVLKPGFYGVITADSFYRPTKKSWESPNWKKEFAAYSKNHGLGDKDVRLMTHKGSFARSTRATKPVIGGDRFDITKMPEVIKKRFGLGAEEE